MIRACTRAIGGTRPEEHFFSALFVLTLVQHETSPVIAIAVVVGVSVTACVSMTASQT
jgi:hypothetical protein